MIVVMTGNTGFAGQKLIPSMHEKLAMEKRLVDNRGLSNILIRVDGNVSMEDIPFMLEEGATMLAERTSSGFRKEDSVKESVEIIRSLFEKHAKD